MWQMIVNWTAASVTQPYFQSTYTLCCLYVRILFDILMSSYQHSFYFSTLLAFNGASVFLYGIYALVAIDITSTDRKMTWPTKSEFVLISDTFFSAYSKPKFKSNDVKSLLFKTIIRMNCIRQIYIFKDFMSFLISLNSSWAHQTQWKYCSIFLS
jgi:hypothetical protein